MLCPFLYPYFIEYIVLNVFVIEIEIVIRMGISVAYPFFPFLLCFQIWYLDLGIKSVNILKNVRLATRREKNTIYPKKKKKPTENSRAFMIQI